jgi:hypothetical protein
MQIHATPQVDLTLPFEEVDIEYNPLHDLQREMSEDKFRQDENSDGLNGIWIPFGRKQTGRLDRVVSCRKMSKLLSQVKDLYEIPPSIRGQMYRYFEHCMDTHKLTELKVHLKDYQQHVADFQITKVHSYPQIV